MEFNFIREKYPNIVEQMRVAAIMAGTDILAVYAQEDFGISIKEDESPVTLADRKADEKIIGILVHAFPDIPIISEESHGDLEVNLPEIFFLVDPLDGTKEFIKRTGEFTVNIALVVKGSVELGVVFVPETRDLYYRGLDGMSYLERHANVNEVRGDIIDIACRPVDLANLIVVQSASHSTPDTKTYIAQYRPKSSKSAGSSLKFCLISNGTADLYPRLGPTMEWDTGAAHAVLKGAGGNVYCLDTLEEMMYGKSGLKNSFFVAASEKMVLISYIEEK